MLRCLWLLILITEATSLSVAQNTCAKQPEFVRTLQFDLSRSGFSTSDKMNRGMIFAEFKDPSNPVEYAKVYQHPSWKKAGYLGTIVFDEKGNIFVAPLPVVNTLYNPVHEKNTIFKIDHETGEMEKFISLPLESSYYPDNPFGIVGMTYDCDLQTLFVSTLEGSSAREEKGRIYSIALSSGKITLLLDKTDGLGLATVSIKGEKKLFFGSARSGKVYSIRITDSDPLKTLPQLEIDISGEGPRGDDKVRKIKYRTDGSLQLFAVEFDFNLIAPTVKQENTYFYHLNPATGKWTLH